MGFVLFYQASSTSPLAARALVWSSSPRPAQSVRNMCPRSPAAAGTLWVLEWRGVSICIDESALGGIPVVMFVLFTNGLWHSVRVMIELCDEG